MSSLAGIVLLVQAAARSVCLLRVDPPDRENANAGKRGRRAAGVRVLQVSGMSVVGINGFEDCIGERRSHGRLWKRGQGWRT